jgi:hypothetical protein
MGESPREQIGREPIELVAPLEVLDERSRMDLGGRRDFDRLLDAQLGTNLALHEIGDLALQRENVAQAPLVDFSPEVLVGLCIDQLESDPNQLALPQHGPLDHHPDAEALRDLRQ